MSNNNNECLLKNYKLCFIGQVIPEGDDYFLDRIMAAPGKTPAIRFQNGFIEALKLTGLNVSLILKARLVPIRIPLKFYKFLIPYKKLKHGTIPVMHVPFLNIPNIKQLIVDWGAFITILIWSLKNLLSNRLVFMYNVDFPNLFTVSLACKITGTKLHTHISDICPDGTKHSQGKLSLALQRRSFKRVDSISVGNKLITYIPFISKYHSDGVWIPFGLSAESIHKYKKIQSLILSRKSNNIFKVVYVWGLDHNYNIELILDACKYLDQEKYNIVIAGDGSKVEKIKEYVKEYKNISFLGMISYDQVLKLGAGVDK